MNYYIDTEFYESGPNNPVRLISIGIVSEDGREFYAENKDFDWSAVPEDHWIQKNVRPHLKYEKRLKEGQEFEVINRSALRVNVVCDLAFLSGYIRVFMEGTSPTFYGYFADYDWVAFCQIFGTMMDLPKGFPMYCRELKQIMDEKGLTKEWKQEVCPDPVGEHNALVDARWNMKLHEALKLQQFRNHYPVIEKAKPTTTPTPRRWRDLKLSVRLANALSQYDNLQTLEEISQYKRSDLLRFSNLGRRTADELEGLLSAAGLRFADEN